MSYHVNYKLLDNKSVVIEEYNNHPCYSRITYSSLPKTIYGILLYDKCSNFIITEPQIKAWIKHLNSWGFPCKYKGIKDNNYEFLIPIKTDKEQIYIKKLHLNSSLMLIRYMLEDKIKNMLPVYFNILKEVGPKCDKFVAMQLAHIGLSYNCNHTLRSQNLQELVTLSDIKNRIDNELVTIYDATTINTSSHWERKIIKYFYYNNLKELYHIMITKKYPKTPIYVVGGAVHYANWLPNSTIVDSVEKAEVILFTGGEDIDPILYREIKGRNTFSNLNRDIKEVEIFNKAKLLNKKMLGVCRGSQFLCVMAGGRLIQHQENKHSEHKICLNITGSYIDEHTINITSTHHQAAFPYNLRQYDFRVIGWTNAISDYHLDGNGLEMSPNKECEIVYYKNINALGIQGHPEMKSYQNNPENTRSLSKLKELFTMFIENKL